MITENNLVEYQKMAEPYLKDLDGLTLNHFAINTRDAREYEDVSRYAGLFLHEVNFHGRRIGTVKFGKYILEILEPKPEDKHTLYGIDHIGYVKSDFSEWVKTYEGKIATRFDVGSTHGIKITPKPGIIIEIRNNNILDSVDDFNFADK